MEELDGEGLFLGVSVQVVEVAFFEGGKYWPRMANADAVHKSKSQGASRSRDIRRATLLILRHGRCVGRSRCLVSRAGSRVARFRELMSDD